MKKSNNIVVALIISATFSGAAIAADTKSFNEELSDVRMNISKKILENKLYQTELEGLQKQKEIQDVKNNLEGVSTSTQQANGISQKQDRVEEDYTFKFNQSLNEEDILSKDNDWQQSVGFIYKDDLSIENDKTSLNSPISSLTGSEDLDFEAMLEQVSSEVKKDDITMNKEALDAESSLSTVDEFKLTSVELGKLMVTPTEKIATMKVSYITNNGYQKINGSKVFDVSEGKKFNVKNKVDFEVISISDSGVSYKNINTGKIEVVNR